MSEEIEDNGEPVINLDDVSDTISIESIDPAPTVPEPVVEPESTEVKEEVVSSTETQEPVKIVNKHRKYQVNYKYSHDVPKWKPDEVIIDFPSLVNEEAKQVIEQTPNVDLTDTDASDKWATVLRNGMENTTFQDMYVNTLDRENANFLEEIAYKGAKLAISELKTNFTSANLQGERALLAFTKHLGIGSLFQIPLWHTGIWVTLKTPTELEIIELNREMVSDKITLGRGTYGMAFSNTLSYTIERVVRFALNHIYDTSLKAEALENKDLREIIKMQDLNTLVWGIVCAMYPRGFQYQRACLSNPEKCNHIVQEQINLTKLLRVDSDSLDESHKCHMSVRQHKSRSLETVMDYQDTLANISNKVITMEDESIKLTLRTPTLQDHIDSGTKWISNIVDTVEKVVGSAGKKDEKDSLITQYAQATSLRQISYWIKSIEFGDNVVDDNTTLEKLLDILSQEDDKREFIIKNVADYIQETTISLVGIPSYNCPKCGEVQKLDYSEGGVFANIIPLDVIQLFFDQHVQRIQRIAER